MGLSALCCWWLSALGWQVEAISWVDVTDLTNFFPGLAIPFFVDSMGVSGSQSFSSRHGEFKEFQTLQLRSAKLFTGPHCVQPPSRSLRCPTALQVWALVHHDGYGERAGRTGFKSLYSSIGIVMTSQPPKHGRAPAIEDQTASDRASLFLWCLSPRFETVIRVN